MTQNLIDDVMTQLNHIHQTPKLAVIIARKEILRDNINYLVNESNWIKSRLDKYYPMGYSECIFVKRLVYHRNKILSYLDKINGYDEIHDEFHQFNTLLNELYMEVITTPLTNGLYFVGFKIENYILNHSLEEENLIRFLN